MELNWAFRELRPLGGGALGGGGAIRRLGHSRGVLRGRVGKGKGGRLSRILEESSRWSVEN